MLSRSFHRRLTSFSEQHATLHDLHTGDIIQVSSCHQGLKAALHLAESRVIVRARTVSGGDVKHSIIAGIPHLIPVRYSKHHSSRGLPFVLVTVGQDGRALHARVTPGHHEFSRPALAKDLLEIGVGERRPFLPCAHQDEVSASCRFGTQSDVDALSLRRARPHQIQERQGVGGVYLGLNLVILQGERSSVKALGFNAGRAVARRRQKRLTDPLQLCSAMNLS